MRYWFFFLLSLPAFCKQPICFSDNGIYPERAAAVARDEKLFHEFKRDPLMAIFCDNLSREEGEAFLQKIEPELRARLEECRFSESLGHPSTYTYKVGTFSPSMLRDLKLAGDMAKLCGPMEGLKVLQIGGGYGGMCALFSKLFAPKSYTIHDLPGCLELCKRYLHALDVQNISYHELGQIPPGEFDLVISHLAFSEMDRTVQKTYLDKVFAKAKAGFLVCAPAHWKEIPIASAEYKRVKPLPKEELLKALSAKGIEAAWLPEDPAEGKEYYILYWKKE